MAPIPIAQIPPFLNDYRVLAALPQYRSAAATAPNHDTMIVLVHRPDADHDKYVVASWMPRYGDAWDSGDYHSDLNAALAALTERAFGLDDIAKRFAKALKPHDEGSAPPEGFTRYRVEIDVPHAIDSSELLSHVQQLAVDLIDESEDDEHEHPGPNVVQTIEDRVSVQMMGG